VKEEGEVLISVPRPRVGQGRFDRRPTFFLRDR
jgi:hypothetical protein